MKTNRWWTIAAFLGGLLFAASLRAADTAVVKGDVVNVRGQPTIFSEVVTQLKKGDTVTVLEEITVDKPKADEPDKWSRIQMPASVTVWVHGDYIDPAASAVTASRLNIRSGPSENHSVVGIAERDTALKIIRAVDDWIEIEPPPGTFAFVASELLGPPPAKPETEPKPKPAPKPAPKPEPEPLEVQTLTPESPPVAAAKEPTPPPQALPPAPAIASPPPLVTPPPVAKPPPKAESLPPKRVVTREGIVRRTASIQAPTAYELGDPATGAALDYLYPVSSDIILKNYRGKKVIVSGQEAMDERWPNTPVLKVETLQVTP